MRLNEIENNEDQKLKSWFGASKVVGKDGKPLLVYHGTNSNFTIFDRNKTTSEMSGPSKFGFWFTNDLTLAELFGKNLMKCYIRITKPKVITDEQWNNIRDRHAKNQRWFEQWRNTLQSQGYDGLIIRGSSNAHISAAQKGYIPMNEPDIFSVFSANQVKSAIKSGYNDSNDDIHETGLA